MLFDNQKDPAQMHNVINKPEYAETVKDVYKRQPMCASFPAACTAA